MSSEIHLKRFTSLNRYSPIKKFHLSLVSEFSMKILDFNLPLMSNWLASHENNIILLNIIVCI